MNTACEILKIAVPRLEEVRGHREASTYSLLLVALLETGEPMTLEQVARRFEEAEVKPYAEALTALKRCRPGRPPVYRNGDLYSLDPYDDDLDLWVFRLGLRPSKAARALERAAAAEPVPETKPEPEPYIPEPMPGPEVPVTATELEEAFDRASLYAWSSQRLACLLLDAFGEPMSRQEASRRLSGYTPYHGLREDWPNRWTHGAVKEEEDGSWKFFPEHRQVGPARVALRKLLTKTRSRAPKKRLETERHAEIQAKIKVLDDEERRASEAMKRCLLFAFPQERPVWVVRLDLATRRLRFFENDFSGLLGELESYDFIGALEVRPLLASLGFDAGPRQLAELGPSQKSMQGPGGRPLKVTAEAMVRGCSDIDKPFEDEKKMRRYLEQGKDLLLKRRLTKAIRALFCVYHYCKLHGAARVVRGNLEGWVRVHWIRRSEWRLYHLKEQAFEHDLEIEAVYGASLSLEDPWRGASRLFAVPERPGHYVLVTRRGELIPDWMILAARLVLGDEEAAGPVH